MFIIGKIANILLVPPGIFLAGICLGVLFILLNKRKPGLILIGACAYLIYSLSTEIVFERLMTPLENAYPPYRLKEQGGAGSSEGYGNPASIVLLGGGIVPLSPEEGGKGSPGTDALKRLLYAFRIQKELGVSLVTTGGNVFNIPGTEPEAVVAARFLEVLGVDSRFIVMETSSRTTWENAEKVKELNLPEPIVLVTSAYHMPRAVYSFKAAGLSVIPAPTDYKTQRTSYTLLSYVPDISYLHGSVKALREYLGLLFYRLRK